MRETGQMRKIFLLIILLTTIVSAIQAQVENEVVVDHEVLNQLFYNGELKDSILTLKARHGYAELDDENKTKAITLFMQRFNVCNVVVHSSKGQCELWQNRKGDAVLIDTWNSNSLDIDNYIRKEDRSKKYGRWFYYVGGSFNGTKESSTGSLNLRGGSFLYKDIIDAAATFNLGYSKVVSASFAGDLGLSSRAYWPIRKLSLSPYLGVGISWSFAPSMYFEFQAFTGVSWFVGPGSLDVGFRYGIKSSWAITIGYSFHPSYIKSMKDAKNKKAVNNQ